jgi:hypothetical protein
MGLTLGADVSQPEPENSHQMLSDGADAYVTMVAPPGPYKFVEDLIFAASQRYIGNERGVLGLEFKLSQLSV